MSSEVTLVAEPRRTTGSRASNRLRVQGLIPGVVYGHGSFPRPVTVPRRELRAALTTDAGSNALVNLNVAGEEMLTIVKDMQRDPVRNIVTHVDFILVSRDEVVSVDVPIVVTGESEEVKAGGGTIDQQLFTLTISARPGNIPNELTVDVSSLVIGDAVRVGDVVLPEGTTTDVDAEEPVVLAQVSQAAQEAEALDIAAAVAVEEGAEGGSAADGDADAVEESST